MCHPEIQRRAHSKRYNWGLLTWSVSYWSLNLEKHLHGHFAKFLESECGIAWEKRSLTLLWVWTPGTLLESQDKKLKMILLLCLWQEKRKSSHCEINSEHFHTFSGVGDNLSEPCYTSWILWMFCLIGLFVFYSLYIFFLIAFSLGNFCWFTCTISDSFLSYIKSTNKHLEGSFHSYSSVWDF